MSDDTHELETAPRADVNPPPPEVALAVFLVREVVALLFVAGWLLFFAGELLTGRYVLPLWVHAVGVATLAYALGLNAAQLVYRPPPLGRRRHER